jgi:hypothetical protein
MGYRCIVSIDEDEEKFSIYRIHCSGINANGNKISEEIILGIPKVDKKYKRIIEVDGSSGTRYRVIIYRGFQDLLSEKFTSDLSVIDWKLTVINAINDIISDALMDLHFDGSKPFKDNVSQRFQTWLNTASNILDVDPDNKMKVKSACEAIIIAVADEPMSHNSRIYDTAWLGKIDPTSTPTSEKINLVYRLAKGAKVQAGKITPGKSIFCSTVSDNAIATILNPRRGYLLRTTFENSVKLVAPEEPRLKPRDNYLDGVHLKTAIMHYGINTYEDAILISESAARKFACNVYKHMTFRSRGEITLKVKEGDPVYPGQVLAYSGKESEVRAEKIVKPAEITKIEHYSVIHHGYIHKAVRFTLHNVYSLQAGDKISNRGAGKGVVNIISDMFMPRTSSGDFMEVCISPESIAGRRVMSLYWEMMAHEAIEDGVSVSTDLGNPKPSFDELAPKYGLKKQLYLRDHKLKNKTFIGDIFWIRINKHACEMNSAVDDQRILTHNDVLVDDARISGQRIDIGKSMAFHDRGFSDILEYAIKQSPYGANLVKSYIDCLVSTANE